MSSITKLTTALGVGLLLAAGAENAGVGGFVQSANADDKLENLKPSEVEAAKKKGGYTNTGFVRDIDWHVRDAAGKPLETPTKWHVHDPFRPNPVKVQGVLLTTPPPADADVLFDGTMASVKKNWVAGRSRKKEPRLWRVPAGKDYIVADTNDIFTKKTYGDAQLHIEWRVPAGRKCQGQGGANSGVMFQDGLYEVQVLESHTNLTYADGQAGALYNHQPPLVNPARPQGEWQSYDIVFTNPRFDAAGKLIAPAYMTVIFNGVVVQANQPMNGPGDWRRVSGYETYSDQKDGKLIPRQRNADGSFRAKGPVRLQWHGDPIEFRNIWIRDISDNKQVQKNAEADVLERLGR
jgi:hypothetical protein